MLEEVTRDRSLHDLGEALVRDRRRRLAEAARIEALVAEGLLEEAGIAVTHLLLAVHMGEGGGSDLAAVRGVTALTRAHAERGNHEDVDLGLAALEALVAKAGPEAATLGEARMRELAAVFDDDEIGRRARQIATRFAKCVAG